MKKSAKRNGKCYRVSSRSAQCAVPRIGELLALDWRTLILIRIENRLPIISRMMDEIETRERARDTTDHSGGESPICIN